MGGAVERIPPIQGEQITVRVLPGKPKEEKEAPPKGKVGE